MNTNFIQTVIKVMKLLSLLPFNFSRCRDKINRKLRSVSRVIHVVIYRIPWLMTVINLIRVLRAIKLVDLCLYSRLHRHCAIIISVCCMKH